MTPPLRDYEAEETVYNGDRAAAAFHAVRDMVRHFTLYDPRIVVAPLPRDGVQAGLEFVQRIRVGLMRVRGPVRVLKVWDHSGSNQGRFGFTYEAMPGHVERGTATFEVRLEGAVVRLRIASQSAPATWYLAVGSPIARWMQKRAVASAFRRARATCKTA